MTYTEQFFARWVDACQDVTERLRLEEVIAQYRALLDTLCLPPLNFTEEVHRVAGVCAQDWIDNGPDSYFDYFLCDQSKKSSVEESVASLGYGLNNLAKMRAIIAELLGGEDTGLASIWDTTHRCTIGDAIRSFVVDSQIINVPYPSGDAADENNTLFRLALRLYWLDTCVQIVKG